MSNPSPQDAIGAVAIIGMSGRFPAAGTLAQFWENLRGGIEAIRPFSDQELLSSGVDPAALTDPNYVKAGAALDDIDLFDARFFGFTPREAEITDPQHRLFLECAWEALENAGCDPGSFAGAIGVYAGVSMSSYLLNLYSIPDIMNSAGGFRALIGNDRDYLPTLLSYKLNLKGPSINVQTACSTSLVAVHLACQSLLDYQCDAALAGGVSINVPQKMGYLYQQGGITSPDGHCRAFDAEAKGTVGGNGVGIVVLKRLEDAIADGDHIWATIKGSAINNDGSAKVGYMAPSIDGQAKVIATAQAMAGVEPETITYVEAHGSATPIGDPIEVAALAKAFRAGTDKKGFCALGSVKTNVGHLGAAAGVAGLIKTVLALNHKLIPPSLHFLRPNPEIDFGGTPFYVNARLSDWKANGESRRAGVSSFGIGGTNAHAVVEEAPEVGPSGPSRPFHLIMLSAKTETALEKATDNLADHLGRHQEVKLADVAYTCHVGRKAFSHRRALVCAGGEDAASALQSRDPKRVLTGYQEETGRPVVFMFPGLGDHYVNMGHGLYKSEPTFRKEVDLCSEILKPILGSDLRDAIYPKSEQPGEDSQEPNQLPAASSAGFDLRKMLAARNKAESRTGENLNRTAVTQPALFVIEYALAKLWAEWGIRPEAMIGYSIGEYVAACLAGVFSLEDALLLVARRAQMIEGLDRGAMLAVPLSESDVSPLLSAGLSLAGINGPSLCVVSGSAAAVEQLEYHLSQREIVSRRLPTSHAFHSSLMMPVSDGLTDLVKAIKLSPPRIPYLSNVTGKWITAAEATDATYWARHLCQPVRFADGIRELNKEPGRILLEVGPGQMLSTLAIQQSNGDPTLGRVALPSIKPSYDRRADSAFLLNTLGHLWLAGVDVDWHGFYKHERRHRLPLPTYPFDRQRYWVEPRERAARFDTAEKRIQSRKIEDWFYTPTWNRSLPPPPLAPGELARNDSGWLLLADDLGIGKSMARMLTEQDQQVITVTRGERFTKFSDFCYAINPLEQKDWDALAEELLAQSRTPHEVVHLWGITSAEAQKTGPEFFDEAHSVGLYSLLSLAQSLGENDGARPLKIAVVSNGSQDVSGDERLIPEKATVVGFCKAITRERPHITARSIDINIPLAGWQEDNLVARLLSDIVTGASDRVAAYRGNHRWVQALQPLPPRTAPRYSAQLRDAGVYLITGGLDSAAFELARYLGEASRARLVIAGSAELPAREIWDQWLTSHDESNAVSVKIKMARSLEESGAQVMMVRAGASNEDEMRMAVEQTLRAFGEINGVIHVANSEELPGETTAAAREGFERRFKQSAHALYVLERVLTGVSIDFGLLLSRLPDPVDGEGPVAYASTQAFFDAFAQAQTQLTPVPWKSLRWDSSISPEEAAAAFDYILSMRHLSQLVVSKSDLLSQVDDFTERESAPALSFHSRPSIRNPYVAPSSQAERTIAEVWREILGIREIGIHDNFFQLGGDSLMGLRAVARLRKTFNVELPVRLLIESPTVAGLALAIEEAIIADIEKMGEGDAASFTSP